MKIGRKRKGSGLIFTIIIFMFVMIVSTGMLSMVAGNYKSRTVESHRVENLYGAESGLDIAYNIISKTVDNANKYSYYKVEQFLDDVSDMLYDDFEDKAKKSNPIEKYKAYLYALYQDIDYEKNINHNVNQNKINQDNENIEKLINQVFRTYFLEYINPSQSDESSEKESLRNNILGSEKNGTNGQYVKDVEGSYSGNNLSEISYNNATIDFKDDSFDDDNKLHINKSEIDVPESSTELIVRYYYEKIVKDNGGVEHKLRTDSFKNFKYKYYETITIPINLVSKFKEQSNIGENEREIGVLYTLTVPNYSEVAFKNSIVTGVSELPGITVGGNLVVNGSLDVTGDIMVEGNDDGNVNLINKYNNGIVINNENSTSNNNVNFYNNVLCRKTFKVMDNVDVNINKNLYAKNIYINSSYNNRSTYLGVKESGSEVILNNDLEINSKKANIDIKNFYGINDKKISTDGFKDQKAQNSSSIVINKADESTLLIQDEAYIRGVAHINTEDGYQTGESVAVKGNYNAYSVPFDAYDKFIYDAPLQLLDGNLDDKIDHFFNYWRKNNSQQYIEDAKDGLDYGGVLFGGMNDGHVHSIGDIVYGEINKEDNSITRKIKKADDDGTNSEWNATITNKKKIFAKNVYNLNLPEDNKKEKEYNYDINNYRHIDKISEILNTQYKSDSFDNNNLWYIKSDYEISEKTDFKGIIIANGDLTIKNKFNLEGNLIVMGNLKIDSNAQVNLKYDRAKTQEIQNNNLSKLNDIFLNYGDDIDFDNPKEMTESNSTIFIKSSLWRIIK
ncbi:MAG: hypothetical protein Q607_CBUC00201G0002 [Clostridium butyricum DORA_1]|nr:MAG: hypothetical protein Q607_CBUC00201G0002 [Clostridium butyricum DORA_1]MDU1509192.1 DUF2572 family protein [Clostridium butyricum]